MFWFQLRIKEISAIAVFAFYYECRKFPSLDFSDFIKNEWNFCQWSCQIVQRMIEISFIGVFDFSDEWKKFFRHWCSRLRLQRTEFASLHFSALSLECRNFLLFSSFFNGLNFIPGDHFQEKVLKILSNIFEKQGQEYSVLKLIKTKHVHDWQVKMDTFSIDLSG